MKLETVIVRARYSQGGKWETAEGSRVRRVFDTCTRGLIPVAFTLTGERASFWLPHTPFGQVWAEVA